MIEDGASLDLMALDGDAPGDVLPSTPGAGDPAGQAQRRLAESFARPRLACPVIVAIPLYKNAHLIPVLIGSLVDCAEELRHLEAEVVLFNDSPDDPDLAHALLDALPLAQAAFSCRLEQNVENQGFVRTANRALAEGAERCCDVLLLNSDTVVFRGAFTEMVRVSRLDPMIGFVNPRSNNATLATLPQQGRFRTAPPGEAFAGWAALAPRLPAVTYVPTAVGFCLLVRWTILAEFGLLDEIYGAGYNEENDLILRAGRRGYRAVLANHAFVWHQGSGSFGLHQTSELERSNALVFNARYPEYAPLCGVYFNSSNYRAEYLIGHLIPDDSGRLDLAFDLSNVVPAHNGTFLAARRLLAGAAEAWRDQFNLYVLCSEEAYAFHRYGDLAVARLDPAGIETFAVIFRVGQPYQLGALELMSEKSAVFGVFMLDTISIDSAPLVEPGLFELWQLTLEHADVVAAISDLTADQYERRFAFGEGVTKLRTLLSLDLAEYLAPDDAPPPAPPGYIFVVGNHYWHKDVAVAAEALALADLDRTVVVVAGAHETAGPATDSGRHAPRPMAQPPNLIRLPAGHLTDAQIGAAYAHASVVVFPSHYEGFGFPLLNALAARRPVFIRPLPVFEQINQALGGEGNLYVFQTVEELVEALQTPPVWNAQTASPGRPGDAVRTTADVRDAIMTALSNVSYARIVRRIRTLRTIKMFAPPPSPGREPLHPIAAAASHPGSEEQAPPVIDLASQPEAAPEPPNETAAELDVVFAPLDPILVPTSATMIEATPASAPPMPAAAGASEDFIEPPDVIGVDGVQDGEAEITHEPQTDMVSDPGPVGERLSSGRGHPFTTTPAAQKAFVALCIGRAAERSAYVFLRLPGVLSAIRAVVATRRFMGGRTAQGD